MNSRPASAKEGQKRMKPQPVDLGQPESASPESQLLYGMHETFARSLSSGLSQFLQTEILVNLAGIRLTTVDDFQKTVPNPSCLIKMRLHPGFERAILYCECPMVLTLLELLLGGTTTSVPAARELTEIEWHLLEEISRVLVRHLGEAWESVKRVEFVVESLGSDASQLAYPYPAASAQRISFSIAFAGQTGYFELAVPCSFFEVAAPARELPPIEDAPLSLDAERNASLLTEAEVEMEVYLDGVQLKFNELASLRPGQIVKFDHVLSIPLQGAVNGTPCFKGHVLGAGHKRAFQVEEVQVA